MRKSPLHIEPLMGRPRLYNSPEEKAQAARHYRKAYIERCVVIIASYNST